jgi:hypothetical protein
MVTNKPPSHFNTANQERIKLENTQFIDKDNSTPHLAAGQGFFHYLNIYYFN